MIPCTGDTKKGKAIEVKVGQMLPKVIMVETWKILFHGYRVPVGIMKKFWKLTVVIAAQPCDHS